MSGGLAKISTRRRRRRKLGTHVLRHFVYINEQQLNQYVSQVEDGLRSIRSTTLTSEASGGGGTDLKIVKGNLERSKGESATAEFADSPSAQFNRLQQLVEGHEDDFGWVTVLQASDLETIRAGLIVDVSAELYESDVTKVAGPNGILGMLPLIQKMQGAFESSKGSSASLPASEQLDAISAFAAQLPDVIMLGDLDEVGWQIVCVLPAVPGLEGEARVVGKVKKVVPAGKFEPLPGVPFIEQLPRAQKRAFVQAGPKDDQTMMWIEGPALILDVLAIYN